MNLFRKIMKDRYGGDQLSIVLLAISILLTILGSLTRLSFIIIISYIPLIFSIYRMFSKDISRRRMENYKFSILISPLYSKYKKLQRRFKERKIYKYLKCINCQTELRLPKGKGKIKITCPKCKEKFEGRT